MDRSMSVGRIILLSICAAVLVIGLVCIGQLVEVVGAGDVVVIQSIWGDLNVYTEPGPVFQGFGKVTVYHKRDQLWFSKKPDQGGKIDESLTVRFNDGAHGAISGSVAWEMPTAKVFVIAAHTKYGSQESIKQQLVRTVIEKAVYMSGPLMSSTESYAERRNELLILIEEQSVSGVYQTETHQEVVTEDSTGKSRTKTVAKLKMGRDGKPLRADKSPLEEFGIRLFNLAINTITYDPTVEKQITDQQTQIAQVQISIAEAKKSEQVAITAEMTGKANAATQEWAQRALNTKEITLAERDKVVAETKATQLREVAKLAKEAAEFTKQEQILLGEGESERRRLVLAADNALDAKIAAYVKVAEVNARAIADYKGNFVPSIVLGGQSSEGTLHGVSNVQDLLNMLLVRTAKDLALDLSATAPLKK